MQINHRERHFEFNVQAHTEISRLCRDEDLANIAELYTGSSINTVKNIIQIAIIMNKAYEDHRIYEDPAHVGVYLTEEDFKFMDYQEILQLEKVLNNVMVKGSEVTVEAEVPKAAKSSKNAKQAEG